MEEEKPNKQEEHIDKSNNKPKIKNEHIIIAAVIILAVVVAAVYILIQPQLPEEVTRIIYENQKYIFSYDIYDSDKISMQNTQEILMLLNGAKKIEIIYDENATEDLPYVTATAFNIVYKMQQYAVYSEKRILDIRAQPLSNTTLDVANTSYIMLKGPASQVIETAISLTNSNIVLVQGLTTDELAMAGDKLVIEFIGLNLENPNFNILIE